MTTAPHDHPSVPPIVREAPPLPADAPAWTELIDLASELLGGRAIACSDDFFAEVGNLVKATSPVFVEDLYTDHGKWMDGWESRRRRGGGHDWAVIALGAPGRIVGVDVDCAHFLGNAPASVELEIAWAPDAADADFADGGDTAGIEWHTLVSDTPTEPGAHNLLSAPAGPAGQPATHVRIHMHPDGGIARLRCHGTVARTFESEAAAGTEVEVSCATLGGRALGCNDEFFCHRGNLILPGPARTMGEGWETRRRRGPGDRDWIVVALACPATLRRLVLDTSHYKGNYPESALVEAIRLDGAGEQILLDPAAAPGWVELLPRSPLGPDAAHEYTVGTELGDVGVVTHLRLSIFPDGGVARLRAYGVPAAAGTAS